MSEKYIQWKPNIDFDASGEEYIPTTYPPYWVRRSDLIQFDTPEPIEDFFGKDVGKEVLDNVNHPSHYNQGSIEAIDYIKSILSEEELIGYYRGSVAKYMHRWRYKNGVEDLKKAEWYNKQLINLMEKK